MAKRTQDAIMVATKPPTVPGNVWLLLIQIIIGYAWLGIGVDRFLTGSEFSDWLAMGQLFIGSALVVCAVILVLPRLRIYREVALAIAFLAFLIGMFLTGASYLEVNTANSSVALVTTVLFWVQAIMLSHIVWQLGVEHRVE